MQEHVRLKVQQLEAQSQEYLHAKERESEQNAEAWLDNAHARWKHEYAAERKEGYNTITEETNKAWAAFKQTNMLLLEERLAEKLKEDFPVLAACFIAELSAKHETGTFVLPERYASLVNGENFNVEISQQEAVVFRKGNLYIEYSIERIMVELGEEIISGMQLEDEIWQR